MCSSEGPCLLSVKHYTMGAPSVGASHSGDWPSSLLPVGVPLPASSTGDPTVYISAGDGVLLPKCCTRTMEGRCWFNKGCSTILFFLWNLGTHNVQFCPSSSHAMLDCQQVTTSIFIPSSAGFLVTKIQCDMHSPLPHHGY